MVLIDDERLNVRKEDIQIKNIRINSLKTYDPKHYQKGKDVLFDLKVR